MATCSNFVTNTQWAPMYPPTKGRPEGVHIKPYPKGQRCLECNKEFDEVYKILLNEVISKKVYFKNQNLCKYEVLNGYCRNREKCKYDHPSSLFAMFTGLQPFIKK